MSALSVGSHPSAPVESILSDEDKAHLNRVARFLKAKSLALPAVMFLESVRPLNLVAAQAVYFGWPFASLFFPGEGMGERLGGLLERRESIDYLIQLLEDPEAAP